MGTDSTGSRRRRKGGCARVKVRIGLNATCFNERPTGATQRFRGLYGEVIRRCPEFEFVLFEPKDCRVGRWFPGSRNVEVVRTPLPSTRGAGKVHGLWYWRSALPGHRLDIFEGFNLPFVADNVRRKVLTIHDVRRLRAVSRMQGLVYAWMLNRGLRLADEVITVSEAMKEEILAFRPDARISVVYNGLNAGEGLPPDNKQLATTKAHRQLPEKFILSVGHLEKRKNFARLIMAMPEIEKFDGDLRLVIIGNDNGERASLEALIDELDLTPKVKIITGVSNSELACMYKLCRAFVFPSVYEGFGIPILEAMALGVPMALSDIPVFREITENKGVYFGAADVKDMAAAIRIVCQSEDERRRLVEYGRQRVKDFSFEVLSKQVEQMYRRLAGEL